MNPSTALARVLVDELVRGGVREAVLSPGSRSAPLAFALADAEAAGRLRLHVRVDERSAAFLALGLAKASGRPVPVVTTSGTATANLHPAVLEADLAGVPLLLLTADRPPELRGTGANQTVDQLGLYGGAVRLFVELGTPGERPGDVAVWRSRTCRVLAAALGDLGTPPGPVHVNVGLREPLVPEEGDWLEPLDGRAGRRAVDRPRRAAGRRRPGRRPARPHRRGARRRPPGASTRRPRAGPPPRLAGGRRAVVRRVADAGGAAAARAAAVLDRLGRGPPTGPGAGRRPADPVARRGPPGRRLAERRRGTARQLARPHRRRVARAARGAGARRRRGRHRSGSTPGSRRARPSTTRCHRWSSRPSSTAGLVEPVVAGRVAGAVEPDGLLVVGSSKPVRDLFLVGPQSGAPVLANRGAAGIDGTVSTAVGAALAHGAQGGGAAYALLGDLTFLHDANGLVLGPDEARPDLTVVVVNNDGGAIFSLLEQGGPRARAHVRARVRHAARRRPGSAVRLHRHAVRPRRRRHRARRRPGARTRPAGGRGAHRPVGGGGARPGAARRGAPGPRRLTRPRPGAIRPGSRGTRSA